LGDAFQGAAGVLLGVGDEPVTPRQVPVERQLVGEHGVDQDHASYVIGMMVEVGVGKEAAE
jgi:hypothetical protein